MAEGVFQIDVPLKKVNSGKVREIYDAGDGNLLLVTSDRLSAFDVIMDDPIPGKGKVLNKMSLFWFDFFKDRVPNAVVESDPKKMDCLKEATPEAIEALKGRCVLMKKAEVLPVECIVRGYIIGSGWKDYQRTGSVCGIPLPEGLQMADKLPEALFTPSTKAEQGEHDENISFDQTVNIIGLSKALKLKEMALMLYTEAAEYARERGIIIADTKFEFGELDGEIVLIDEVLTPDSSRFWPADKVVLGNSPPSYDKQIVRDWLETSDWGKTPPPPKLPSEIIQKASDAYHEIFKKLTGSEV
ncbi:phosphoribosylaminoimidazolesuccinocarboxamide synthase [bacterium]|nr:phosphoribosylaminoimidazolesuccinocarboxamide synthase [bacterium]